MESRVINKDSLKVRVWFIVTVSIIPLLVFSVLDFRAQKEKAAAAMEQGIRVYLQAARSQEAAARNHIGEIFRIMAASDDMRDLDPASCASLSARLLATLDRFSNIGAADPQGHVFCSGRPTKVPVNVSDREWFKDALKAKGMTGGQFLNGRISGAPVVIFGFPVRNSQGDLRAVLFMSSSTAWFDRMAENVQLPEGWKLTLAMQDGTVLSHYPKNTQGSDPRPGSDRSGGLLASDDGTERIAEVVSADGLRRMVGVAPISSTRGVLQVHISAPIGISYAAITQAMYRQLALLALIAAFSAVLARFLVLRLVNNWVRDLVKAVRRIAQGHFGERLPFADGGAELNRLVTVFNDMADALQQREAAQRAAESDLRASQEQLDLVLRGSNDGWWDFDLLAQRFYYSPRWYGMLGYQPGELGSSEDLWLEMLHPDDRAAVRAAFEAALQGQEETWEIEFRMRHKAGHPVPVLTRGCILRDGHGQAIRVSGSSIDLSEIKARDNELRKLLLAVEQSPSSIIIADAEVRIVYANPAFLRVSGYSGSETVGQNPRILQSGRTPRATYDDMWATLKRGAVWRGELINKRKDGSEYIESATISPVADESGCITHYLAIKEDISEQKRVAGELASYQSHLEEMVTQRTYELAQAKETAELASRAKSTFLANMSHEIRTPMNAITGFVHLLGRTSLDDEQREKLAKIDRAAGHLIRVINDILDLSKIESGKLMLESRAFRPADVLATVALMIGDAARLHGVEVSVVSDGLPEQVLGDETRLRQALLNFAGNAAKFTSQGKIVIAGECIGCHAGVCQLKFSVTDTGIGIAADALPRLFQPFEQGDASTTRQHGGTGLGLAISRYIAKLMGGEVGVESQPGQGSTFWLTGRFAEVDADAGSAADNAVARLGAPSVVERLREQHATAAILLVEDDEVNREVVLEFLGDLGLAADTAVNGEDALRVAAARHYDLILMDVQMPVMDGLQATGALRARENYRDTPIVALTADAFEEDRARCLAAGMNDFVSKPIDPAALYEALLRWLSQSHAADQGRARERPAQAAAAAAPAPAPSEAEREQLSVDLATLDSLLQSGNVEASLLFRRLLPQLSVLAPAELSSLQRAIENYDFTQALAHLAALIENLGLPRR